MRLFHAMILLHQLFSFFPLQFVFEHVKATLSQASITIILQPPLQAQGPLCNNATMLTKLLCNGFEVSKVLVGDVGLDSCKVELDPV